MSPISRKAFPIQLCSVPRRTFLFGMSFSEHPTIIFMTSSAFFIQTSVFPEDNSVQTCLCHDGCFFFFDKWENALSNQTDQKLLSPSLISSKLFSTHWFCSEVVIGGGLSFFAALFLVTLADDEPIGFSWTQSSVHVLRFRRQSWMTSFNSSPFLVVPCVRSAQR